MAGRSSSGSSSGKHQRVSQVSTPPTRPGRVMAKRVVVRCCVCRSPLKLSTPRGEPSESSASADGFSILSRTSKGLPCHSKMLRRYESPASAKAGSRSDSQTAAARVTARWDMTKPTASRWRVRASARTAAALSAPARELMIFATQTSARGAKRRLVDSPSRSVTGPGRYGPASWLRLVERLLNDLDGNGMPGSSLHAFTCPEQVLPGPDVQDPPVRCQVCQGRAEAAVAVVAGGHGRVEERLVDRVLPHARPQGEAALSLGAGVDTRAQRVPGDLDLLDAAHGLPFAVRYGVRSAPLSELTGRTVDGSRWC